MEPMQPPDTANPMRLFGGGQILLLTGLEIFRRQKNKEVKYFQICLGPAVFRHRQMIMS